MKNQKHPTCMINIQNKTAVPISEIVFTNNGNFYKTINIDGIDVEKFVEESFDSIKTKRARRPTPTWSPCVISD